MIATVFSFLAILGCVFLFMGIRLDRMSLVWIANGVLAIAFAVLFVDAATYEMPLSYTGAGQ